MVLQQGWPNAPERIDKPFDCKLCYKSFKRKRNLNEHERNVHIPADPLICSYCNRPFKNASSLRGHIFVAHKVVNDQNKRKK